MGGTSCDIGLVARAASSNTRPSSRSHFGIPVTIPCVAVQHDRRRRRLDRLDRQGRLAACRAAERRRRAGPGRLRPGGTEPTVTDANLVARPPRSGLLPRRRDAARRRRRARRRRPARRRARRSRPRPRRWPCVRTADENMANAIRLIAVERGLDPRDFALIAFGGAGPLHARAVAERLGMTTVHRPAASRALLGLRRGDRRGAGRPRADASSPTPTDVDVAGLAATLERLRDERGRRAAAQRRCRRAGGPQLGRHALCRPELRARGAAAGRRARRRRLGGAAASASPADARAPVRLRAAGRAGRADQPAGDGAQPRAAARLRRSSRGGGRPPTERAPVWFDADGRVDCPIYRRAALAARRRRSPGPAVIEEPDSTTLVYPGDELGVEGSGVLILTLRRPAMSERRSSSTPSACTSCTTRSRTSPPRWRS